MKTINKIGGYICLPLLIFSGQFKLLAQVNRLEPVEIKIDYDRSTRKPFYFPPQKLGNKRRIFFYYKEEDTVDVYLNDKIVSSQYVHVQKNDVTGLACIINLNVKPKKANYYKLVLRKKRTYIEMPLDPRYSFVDLYCSTENNIDYWNAIYNNNVPEEGVN